MEDKKPGQTRIAFIAIGSILLIFAIILGFYCWSVRDNPAELKEIAIVAATACATAFGLIMGFFYSDKS